MFGASFFGQSYFGGDYWGKGVSGPTPPPPTPGRSGLGGDDVPYRRSPHRGWDREEWKRRVKEPGEAIERELQEVYDRLTGKEAPISVLAQVDAVVRPVAKQVARDIPLRIDWKKLARDFDRANALMRIWREEQELEAAMEEDDEIMMMAAQ
jgi:hypothetical protein